MHEKGISLEIENEEPKLSGNDKNFFEEVCHNPGGALVKKLGKNKIKKIANVSCKIYLKKKLTV